MFNISFWFASNQIRKDTGIPSHPNDTIRSQTIINAGEKFTENVNLCCHYRNKHEISQKKQEIRLSHDPAVGYVTMEYKSVHNRDILTPIFVAALFTISELWKQWRCASTNEWIKKM
jgi:hypothetical protein